MVAKILSAKDDPHKGKLVLERSNCANCHAAKGAREKHDLEWHVSDKKAPL